LGERSVRNAEAVGSNPIISTKKTLSQPRVLPAAFFLSKVLRGWQTRGCADTFGSLALSAACNLGQPFVS
ncbi:MAG: hypothetical protein WBR24_23365, partial [Desulfobacterales bacterium]